MSVVAAALFATMAMAPNDPANVLPKLPPPSPDAPLNVPVPKSRFELASPLPFIPGVMLDRAQSYYGLANEVARSKNLQARILWVDATANIDRVNTEEKIVALVRQIKQVGFNTVVFDIKPISGQVMYPSKIAPKIQEWKGRVLPNDFDPLAIFVREAKANQIPLFVSLNAFSEGHRDFKVGPGYAKPEWQTVLYEPAVSAISSYGGNFPVHRELNKMPTDGQTIGAFNDPRLTPNGSADAYAVTVNKNGVVEQAFFGAGVNTIRIPRDGSLLVGTGEAARFLRAYAAPQSRMRFESRPQFVPISQRPEQQIPLMMNPNHPEVQQYELDILKEIATNYDIGGVIYDDRMRYGGLNADFSEITQREFEKYLWRRISWPDDVFRFTMSPQLNRGIIPGPYLDAWMTWRAQTLRNFTLRARQTLKATRPNAQLAMYAGSWFGEYSKFGNNWAAPEVEAGFWYLTSEYAQTGMAPLLDFLITGCYYPTSTIYQGLANGISIGYTIEGAGQLSNRLARDQTWTYAGIALSDFKGNPEGLADALQAACGSTQGVMVFDLSHDIEPMWRVFQSAFANDRRAAPHDAPGVLADVRKRRAALDKLGHKDPPVPINAGAAGAGH